MADASLCIDCQGLNIARIFDRSFVPSNVLDKCLGRRHFKTQPSCKLCRAFWEIRSDHNQEEFEIWTGSFLANSSEASKPVHLRALNNSLDDVCIVVMPTGAQHETLPSELGYWPYLTRFGPQQENESCYSVRNVRARPDYTMIGDWIARCRHSHAPCEYHCGSVVAFSAFEGVRMIDVQTQTIEDHEIGQDYVTLSYVWGHFKSQHLQNWRSKPGTPLPSHLPQTIKDAIEVTRILGFRHLWIDQYCIDQGDEKHVTHQIGIMGKIYSDSQLTIIAAAGDSCEYGLPGVGARSRHQVQCQKDFDGIELIASPARPERLIQASKYATRGWTFQEGVLARRRLVFTDEQVYFECRCTYNFESLQRPMSALYSGLATGHPTIAPGIRRGYFEADCAGVARYISAGAKDKRAKWSGHFRTYLQRELKYQSDRWNAFRGVQDLYFPSFHGLPLFNMSSGPNTMAQTHKELARSLGWMNGKWKQSVRTPDFPSFTWMAWTELPLFEQVDIVRQEIEFLNLDDWQPGGNERKCLEVKASTVVLNVRLDGENDRLRLVRETALDVQDDNHFWDQIIVPHIPQTGADAMARSFRLECILLFESERGYCFLAIRRVEDWIERIGMVELDRNDLPTWSSEKERFTLR